MDQSKVLDFYLGVLADWKPEKIYELSDLELEYNHDFIQWLFPLKELSRFNHDAPFLSDKDIWYFQNSSLLRSAMLISFEKMLGFYGLFLEGNVIKQFKHDVELQETWINYGNHNYLRITRILKCLTLCGLKNYALIFYDALIKLHEKFPQDIEEFSVDFWTKAVGKEGF